MAPQRLKPRSVEEVKIEDIDFEAVQECSDKHFLKRYIKILEEDGGYFHELLRACKDKLLEVAPKEYYILYPRVASEREVDEATRDLLDWESVVKETDAALRSAKKGSFAADDSGARTAAPIRGQEPVVARANLQKPEGGPAGRGPKSDRDVYARDKTKMKDYYRAWDSFDVEKMEDDIDEEEREEAEARRRHFDDLKEEQDEANRGSAINVDGLPEGVPEAHRKYLADCEKEKGNEAFYSKDYEEAEAYYSRSLHFRADDPSSWANRALARLKLSQPVGALQDCEHALALNARYMKALHRKGKALYELGRYEEAVRSFQLALQESPGNSQINGDLMVARRRLRSDGPAPPPERPRRVDDPPTCTVEELPDDDDPGGPPPPPPAAGYTRVQIEEDSDSESDDGVQIEEVKAAPAASASTSGRAFRKVAIEEVSGSEDEDEQRPAPAPAAAAAAPPAPQPPAVPASAVPTGFRKVQIVEESDEEDDDRGPAAGAPAAAGLAAAGARGFAPPSREPAAAAPPSPAAAPAPAAGPARAQAAVVCFDDMD